MTAKKLKSVEYNAHQSANEDGACFECECAIIGKPEFYTKRIPKIILLVELKPFHYVEIIYENGDQKRVYNISTIEFLNNE